MLGFLDLSEPAIVPCKVMWGRGAKQYVFFREMIQSFYQILSEVCDLIDQDSLS